MASQANKSFVQKERFSLRELDSPACLIQQIRDELPKKPLRSGEMIRIRTLKVWCELIEQQNKKLDLVFDLLLDLKEKRRLYD